jgi:hypothetical protein
MHQGVSETDFLLSGKFLCRYAQVIFDRVGAERRCAKYEDDGLVALEPTVKERRYGRRERVWQSGNGKQGNISSLWSWQ